MGRNLAHHNYHIDRKMFSKNSKNKIELFECNLSAIVQLKTFEK